MELFALIEGFPNSSPLLGTVWETHPYTVWLRIAKKKSILGFLVEELKKNNDENGETSDPFVSKRNK